MAIRFFSSNSKELIPAICLFFCTGISAFLLSLQGINFGDMGYYLTNQYWLVENFQRYIFSDSRFVPFTNLVGGTWLHLAPAHTLLWAVLGGSLVYASTATLVYVTVRCIFPRENRAKQAILAFIVFLLSLGIATTTVAKTIDTYTFPAFLVSFFFSLLAVWMFRPVKHYRTVFLLVLGLVLALIIFSRLNLILFALLLLCVLAGTEFLPGPWQIFRRQEMGILVVGGCISASILFIIPILCSGIDLGAFITHFAPTGREGTHSLGILMSKYAIDLMYILGYAGITGVAIAALRRTKNPGRSFVIASLIIVMGSLLILSLSLWNSGMFRIISSGQVTFLLTGFSFAILVIMILDNLPLLLKTREMMEGKLPGREDENPGIGHGTAHRNYHLILFLSLALIAALMGCIGSGAGLLRVAYGLSLPVCIAISIVLQGIPGRIGSESREGASIHQNVAPVIIFCLLCMTLLTGSLYLELHTSVIDSPRPLLTEPFTHPSLALIHSTPERVAVVDDLLFTLDRYNITGKKVLFLNAIPIFYHLTRTEPAYYENPYPLTRSENEVKKWQRAIERRGDLPEYVIIAKKYPDRHWPSSTIRHTLIDDLEKRYRNDLHYLETWQNDAFIIYQRQRV